MTERPISGLCDSCVHQKLVPNTRGSVFSLCLRSRSDSRYPRRLSHKCPPVRPQTVKLAPSGNGRGLRAPNSGCRGRQSVPVELQEVVSGGDQAPFGADGRPASAFEPPSAPGLLDLGEDRLDHPLSS